MKKEILEKLFNHPQNMIIEGNISSGKTTNTLFPIVDKIIEQKENLLILDAREEYLHQYQEKLKENGYQTIIINLREPDKSEGWNPLSYPYQLYQNGKIDKAQECLEKIGKTCFYEKQVQDPFWDNAASDIFTGMTLGLFEDGTPEEVNLNSIMNMFNQAEEKIGGSIYLNEYFNAKNPTSNAYTFASATILAPKETKGSILSVARQRLGMYATRENLSQMMNKTTFDVENSLHKPTAFMVIARDENSALNTVATMFIEQLYTRLIDLKVDTKFHFILDNFDSIEICHDLVDILSSCIPRNIKIYIATRSLSKLIDTYGKYMLKLCDLISIRNEDIKIEMGNQEEKIEKDFETITIPKNTIFYPSYEKETIKCFDLKEKVHQIRHAKIIEALNAQPDDGEISNIQKQIDDKFKKLTEQEAYYQAKEHKSELEQFKIED